jgi:hypothetical protein
VLLLLLWSLLLPSLLIVQLLCLCHRHGGTQLLPRPLLQDTSQQQDRYGVGSSLTAQVRMTTPLLQHLSILRSAHAATQQASH